MKKILTIVLMSVLWTTRLGLASIHDCWDPEKLNRMNFGMSQREHFFIPTYYTFKNELEI